MSYVIKRIDDMESTYGGAMKRARGELGVTAFGMQVLDLPANFDGYPEHDHADDGQEEVYVVLAGAIDVEIKGSRHSLGTGSMLRVAAGVPRKIYTPGQAARVLAIGGVPGQAYAPTEMGNLGAPDPTAAAST